MLGRLSPETARRDTGDGKCLNHLRCWYKKTPMVIPEILASIVGRHFSRVSENVGGVVRGMERQLWWCILDKVSAGMYIYAQASLTLWNVWGLFLQYLMVWAAVWGWLYLGLGPGLPSTASEAQDLPNPCPCSPCSHPHQGTQPGEGTSRDWREGGSKALGAPRSPQRGQEGTSHVSVKAQAQG